MERYDTLCCVNYIHVCVADVHRRITNGVLEERQRSKDAALQLVESVMTDSRCLTVRARTRLRQQPKFQELLVSFARDTGAADELESSAKGLSFVIVTSVVLTVMQRRAR